MSALTAKCPGCGTMVEIDEGKKRASCPKCSTWVDARDAVVAEASMDIRPMADPELATYNSGGYRASVEQIKQSIATETPEIKPVTPAVKPIEHIGSRPLAPSQKPIAGNTTSPERTELNTSGSVEPPVKRIPRNMDSPEHSEPGAVSPIPPNTDAPAPDMPLSEFVAELKTPFHSANNEVPTEPAVNAVPVFKPLSSAAAASLQNSTSMIRDKRQSLEKQIEQDNIFRKATSFLEQGQFISSEPLFKAMTEKYPEDYRAWWGLLRSMTRDLKTNMKPDEAPEYFKKACEFAPDEIEADIRKTYMQWLKTVAVKHDRDHPSHVADSAPHSAARPQNNSVPISRQDAQGAGNTATNPSDKSCLKACLLVPFILMGFLITFILAVSTESAMPLLFFFILVAIIIYATKKKN